MSLPKDNRLMGEKENKFPSIKSSESVSTPTMELDGKKEPINEQEPQTFSINGKEARYKAIMDYLQHEDDRAQKRHEETIQLRKSYSCRAFWFLCIFALFCGVIIVLQGFQIKCFHLDRISMSTLIGGTAVSVIGLVHTILNGLFPSKGYDNQPTEFLNKIINNNNLFKK